MTAERYELHALDNDTATFRRWDAERGRRTLISVALGQWLSWDRPVIITADIAPGPVIVVEDSAVNDPLLPRAHAGHISEEEDGDGEPTLWRMDAFGSMCPLFRRVDLTDAGRRYWPEIVSALTGRAS